MQSQLQRSHPSQTDVISSALQTVSFPETDAEYEKDLTSSIAAFGGEN